MFNPLPPKPDFPTQERETLQFWKETHAFEKLRELRKDGQPFSFLDGPITANNPMGVHHAWGRTYKDLWQRYHAMRGHAERWQNGFDCQGLWVEVNVEKDLGFKTKKDIEEYGLAAFVLLCKQRVLNYAAVQTEQSIRLGMWMDWNDPDQLRLLRDKLGEDPNGVLTLEGPEGPVTGTAEQLVGRLGLPELGGSYFTFSDKNNYDIWRFLKTCSEQGWVYKGTDVMPWCWRCGTGISQHEIVTEGYIEKTDPGLTVKFPLLDRPGESLLVWTTTPWTLTSNVAAAVGPELTYVRVKQGEEIFYLSKGTTSILRGPFEVLDEMPGRALEGWRYAGPFDELEAAHHPGGWAEPGLRRLFAHIPKSAAASHRVILWDEVGEAEGTGIVHTAPGCGEEDYQLHKQYALPVIAPLDENGTYIEGFGWLTGKHVSEVADAIVENLKEKGRFYRLENYTHRYPQCWRCATPLVFRLVDEWFIGMNGLREPMMAVTRQMRWIPDFGLDRELDWLRNMHDWMISKKRYWGLALPIWECEHCGHFEVMGSRDELEERAVEGWQTFDGHTPHRPYIDAVKIACGKCGGKVGRIQDVGNPWLDAGIVAISTMRYGAEMDYWRKWFPADFITESFPGQFRNWFYSLLAMSTALENLPPARTVLGYATLLAEDGRAMHKSWGNSIEFNEAADTIGADVMRWMYANQRYDADMLFGYNLAKETVKRFFLPLWNVYAFFVTYARLDGWTPVEGRRNAAREEGNDLDSWILARLQQLIAEVSAALDDYQVNKAAQPIEQFVDDLSNWYVRRSRRRFWKSEADADKQAAYATLYEVLVTLTQLLAPFVPFLSEQLYQNLVRGVNPEAPLSVHHCDWPTPEETLHASRTSLLADMNIARTVVTLGHATRAAGNLKVRQPLARAVVVVAPNQRESVLRMRDLIADELNVKTVELAENEAELITYKLLPNNKLLGPKYGQLFPKLRAALNEVNPAETVAALRGGNTLALNVEGQTVSLTAEEVLVNPQPKPGFAVQADTTAGVVVALDMMITPELRAEGLAREFVRRVQDLRKSAGFDISDRIHTYFTASPDLMSALQGFAAYVKAETLSVELHPGPAPDGATVVTDSFDGETVTLSLERAPLVSKSKIARGKSKVVSPKSKVQSRKSKVQSPKSKATRPRRKTAAKKTVRAKSDGKVKSEKPAAKKTARPSSDEKTKIEKSAAKQPRYARAVSDRDDLDQKAVAEKPKDKKSKGKDKRADKAKKSKGKDKKSKAKGKGRKDSANRKNSANKKKSTKAKASKNKKGAKKAKRS